MKTLCGLWLAAALCVAARGALHGEAIVYHQEGTTLEGYLAYDDAMTNRRPGVLVIHQWKGLGAYEKHRADMLAKLGYVAFAADIYGQGVRPADAQAAAAEAGKYKADRALLRARANAGLAALKRQPLVDPQRMAAIGYCFGGTVVLELARSGATLAGVVSFHGGLDSPHPHDARSIVCKVLVLHGADDPSVSSAELSAFEREMRNAGVDWQLIKYGGAVHSFTDPDAGNKPATGAAYNPLADQRSWEHMRVFFNEIFK